MARPRQKTLAKALVINELADKPKHIKEVLESVGYPTSTAESQAKRVIAQKGVQEEIKTMAQALEAQGINSIKIAEKIEVLLNAETPIYKNNNETGEVEHVGDKPDYQAVDKGISHALKIGIGGGYAPEKSINVNVEIVDRKAMQELADKINKEMLNANTRTSNGGVGTLPSNLAKEVRDENGEGSTA